MRRLVLEDGFRADGRSIDAVRPIWSRAGVLPRTHGSVLFTRGETQALAVTTLGCSRSAQRIDTMSADDEEQRFYLQVWGGWRGAGWAEGRTWGGGATTGEVGPMGLCAGRG